MRGIGFCFLRQSVRLAIVQNIVGGHIQGLVVATDKDFRANGRLLMSSTTSTSISVKRSARKAEAAAGCGGQGRE
jgi:hypothetical protein